MQWNIDLLSKFVAPGISDFTDAQIPDLMPEFPEAEYWLANHFLNNMMSGAFRDRSRQVALGYIRRVHHAFVAYHQARTATLHFLDGNQPDNPYVRRYYGAIALWEWYSLQAAMAIDLFKWLSGGVGAFTKNDGSRAFRLYSIANQIKHVASCVDSGQCGPNESVPLWLSNAGLHSYGIVVSFSEAADELRSLAELADKLQDPTSFVECRKAQST